MIVRRISVHNFGPYLGRFDVSLQEGATVFVAQYDGSPERSNRGGKSMIAVDAPMFALFGTFRGKADDVPHRSIAGQEDAWSEVEVETSKGEIHTLRQGRSADGQAIRELDGCSIKQADLARFVQEQILGLTVEEYLHTNAVIQGRIGSFMEMGPTDKRRLISPWFRTDRWLPRAELARRRLFDAKQELKQLHQRRVDLVQIVNELPLLEEELNDLEKHLTADEQDADEMRIRYERLKAESEVSKSDRSKVMDLRRQLDDLSTRNTRARRALEREYDEVVQSGKTKKSQLDEAKQNRQEIEELVEVVEGMEVANQRLNELTAERSRIRTEAGQMERSRSELLRRYQDMRERLTGTCPILGEECDRVTKSASALKELVRAGKEAAADLKKLETDAAERVIPEIEQLTERLRWITDCRRRLDLLRKSPTVEQLEQQLNELRGRAKRLQKDLKNPPDPGEKPLRQQISELEEILIASDRSSDEVERMAQEARFLAAKVKASRDRVAKKLVQVESAKAAKTELLRSEERETELQRSVQDLSWAAYAFSAVGIPSREMENAFSTAQDAMNSVLEGLGTGLRVGFSPTRELKQWEPSCLACGTLFQKGERTHRCQECDAPRRRKLKDELRLEILDGDQVGSYETDSGGGKTLISLGTRLGLARLPGMIRAVRCQHLLIDEPDGQLDGPNRDALHALLNTKMEGLGIRQVLLVTHAPARDSFRQVVEVTRIEAENRSEVKNL